MLKVFLSAVALAAAIILWLGNSMSLEPKKRKRLFSAVSEAYKNLNSSNSLVHNQLGDALLLDDDDFFSDDSKMDNLREWHSVELEREFVGYISYALRRFNTRANIWKN